MKKFMGKKGMWQAWGKIVWVKLILASLLVASFGRCWAAQQTGTQDTVLMAEVSRPDVTVRKVKMVLSDPEEQTAINAHDAAGNSAFLRVILNDKLSGAVKIEILQELLKHGVDITQEVDNNGKTALMLAVERNYPEVVSFLLTQRYTTTDANLNQVFVVATINQQDKQGKTALMLAVDNQFFDMIKLLVDAGADIKHKDAQGHDGLYYISNTINAKNNRTVLMSAAQQNNQDMVEFLTRLGVDTEVKDSNGWTALMFAAQHGSQELVRVLLSAGAHASAQNNYGETPLIVAVKHDKAEIIDLLLSDKQGLASIDYVDSDGKTALFRAVEKKSGVSTQRLLAKGASAKIAETKGDLMTPLISAVRQGWVEGAKLLLASGVANVALEAKDIHGMTALRCAAEQGDPEVVKLLLNAGANTLAKSSSGEMALAFAVRHDKPEIIDLLLSQGNDLALMGADNEGRTALFRAVEKKSVPLVQKLLEKGASPWVAGAAGEKAIGMTPMMLAARENWLEGARLMLNKNAIGINLVDKDGKTALMYAVLKSHWDMVKLLVDLSHGEINARERDTSLFEAVAKKSLDEVKQLLAKGANDRIGTITPLMLAARENWLEGVKLMLNKNAIGINLVDKEGKTALMYLADCNPYANEDMTITMKLFTDNGADVKIKDKQGRDVFYHLQQNPRFSLQDLKDKTVGEYCAGCCFGINLIVCAESKRFCIDNQCGFYCTKTIGRGNPYGETKSNDKWWKNCQRNSGGTGARWFHPGRWSDPWVPAQWWIK